MEGTNSTSSDYWDRHEQDLTNDHPVRLGLFVRSLAGPPGTHARQSRLLARLKTLETAAVVAESTVTVWGERVCVSECCAGRTGGGRIRDAAETLCEWERGHDWHSLGFDRHEVDASITDERFQVIDLPTMSLAVYVDASLVGVFPAVVEDTAWTIEKYLDWIEATLGDPVESLMREG